MRQDEPGKNLVEREEDTKMKKMMMNTSGRNGKVKEGKRGKKERGEEECKKWKKAEPARSYGSIRGGESVCRCVYCERL